MKQLHITNGDGAANIIKRCAVPGDVLPWRDPMHHGPFPADVTLEEVSIVRARYLTGDGLDDQGVLRDFRLRDEHLRAAAQYDRVVLWFEHDLLDQLQILQLLDYFATAEINAAQLEMICIGTFPGVANFRGIGQLDEEQMASLVDQRRAVTQEQKTIAVAGWAAFRSNDPTDLWEFTRRDLGALPYLKTALLRHFQEYPFLQTGLTRTEWQLLSMVGKGVLGPVELFVQNMDMEQALFIGDWPTFSTLNRLCKMGVLECQPSPFFYPPAGPDNRRAFRDQAFALTEIGRDILRGEKDAFDVAKRDQWLGGVHLLSDQPMWTWDAKRGLPTLRMP